jgi:hypothetical protein
MTEQLQKEIIAQKEREQKLKDEAQMTSAKDFKMDKSTDADIAAMKGVLDFLKDWGDEDGAAPKPTADNIIGIDNDLLFGLDNMAPAPINQDQIARAREVSADLPEVLPEREISTLDLTENINSSFSEDQQMVKGGETSNATVVDEFSGVGLPPEILATLGEISNSSSVAKSSTPKPENNIPSSESFSQPTPEITQKTPAKEDLIYGIQIYSEEVPPIPLNDYISFEVGTLSNAAPGEENLGDTVEENINYDSTSPTEASTNPDGSPNFDAMASEYDDPDFIDLEEDAMLDALNELGMSPEKKKEIK